MHASTRPIGHVASLLAFALMSACATTEVDVARPSASRRAPDIVGRSMPSTMGASFFSTNFIVSVQVLAGGTSLLLHGSELDPAKSALDEWDMTESTSFTVEQVAMRHANDWYLAGTNAAGDLRIERWELIHSPGAYYSEILAAGTAPGTAVTTPSLVVAMEEDRYVPPSARVRPVFHKVLIHQGSALGRIVRMVVEPDGRYLVLQLASSAGSYELRQITLPYSGSVGIGSTQLAGSVSSSSLSSILAMGFCDHPRRGRALFINCEGQDFFLWDRTNDGLFESQVVLTSSDSLRDFPYEAWSRIY